MKRYKSLDQKMMKMSGSELLEFLSDNPEMSEYHDDLRQRLSISYDKNTPPEQVKKRKATITDWEYEPE